MRIAVFALLLAVTSACAQGTAACGPAGSDLKISRDKSIHAVTQPNPDKARIYFIHEASAPGKLPATYPVVKIGLDGAWVGGNHEDSFFSVDVIPGEHHFCAMLQTSWYDPRLQLAHVNAEAGKTYYFRTRLILSGAVEMLDMEPIDSDEGSYLVSQYPMSSSKPKK